MVDELVKEIQKDIRENKVMIYMKGTPEMPMCGFSKAAVDVIGSYAVPFGAKDILPNPAYREALFQVSQWPTIPQVFIGGEFIGGSDIVRELHEQGELAEKIKAACGEEAKT